MMLLRKLRTILLMLLVSTYLFSHFFTLIMIPVPTTIRASVERYGGRVRPVDVCYSVPYEQDREGYASAVYAVIPAVLHPYSPDCKAFLPR